MRALDISGVRYGRLIAKECIGVNKHKHRVWKCECDCGNEHEVSIKSLRAGYTRSCGCLHKETVAEIQRAKALPEDERLRRTKESRKRTKSKIKADPARAMQTRLSRLFRHSLNRVGSIKSSPTLERLGFNPSELKEHIESLFVDGMGWHNMDKWQIDHIYPASTAKNEADVIRLNQLCNLRPLWADENNKKRATIPVFE